MLLGEALNVTPTSTNIIAKVAGGDIVTCVDTVHVANKVLVPVLPAEEMVEVELTIGE